METPAAPTTPADVRGPDTGSAPAERAPSRAQRVREWFWRGRSLRAARAASTNQPASRRALRGRARVAAELAARAVDPRFTRPAPPNEALACELYRQSIQWSLQALDGAGDAKAALEPELARESFATLARRSSAECSLLRTRWAALSDALLAEIDRPERELRVLRVQRWLRVALVGGVLAALAVTALTLSSLSEQRRDLAQGKPWRASSSGASACRSPLQYCDESPAFFFHTGEEKDPWLEIDLGAKTPISAVRVLNRLDCCFERAAPLVVELSNDQQNWKQVARRDRNFKSWKAEFAPTAARWVRVRAPGKSILHLHQIRVLP